MWTKLKWNQCDASYKFFPITENKASYSQQSDSFDIALTLNKSSSVASENNRNEFTFCGFHS